MIRRSVVGFGVALVSLAFACTGSDEEKVEFSAAEIAKFEELSPAPTAVDDTTNKYSKDPAAVDLGHRLFFDAGYSGPIVVGDDGMNGGLGAEGEKGKVSCRSCHEGDWLIDTHSQPNGTSLGVDWFIRNSPTMVNVATYDKQFGWVGYCDNLWGKALIPAEFVMGTTRTDIVRYLFDNYRDEYDAIFDVGLEGGLADEDRFPPTATPLNPDSPWAAMDPADQAIVNQAFANFGKALAAYLGQLISGDSDFDRFVAGDDTALSESAKRGLRLFIGKAACVECHSGPTFSDEEFHVTGVPQIGEYVAPAPGYDDGRLGAIDIYLGWDFNTAGPYNDDSSVDRTQGVSKDPALEGAFRTKGLRNVAMTAPYMHTGHLQTLLEVVEFYNLGGADAEFAGEKDSLIVPLNLSEQEKSDLVAFLESLTGEGVPAEWLVDPN
ncbi:MAG TPA: hypothetical protein ENJ18_10380 [Nannocystis exedens]|nr:hypothetical protein [Nannocystis exedens]